MAQQPDEIPSVHPDRVHPRTRLPFRFDGPEKHGHYFLSLLAPVAVPRVYLLNEKGALVKDQILACDAHRTK
jgi:hypothetical protein